MTKRLSRKEWLKKRDAMNAQLRADIRDEKRRAEETLEPLRPGLDQLPEHLWPEQDEGRAKRDMPWHLRD